MLESSIPLTSLNVTLKRLADWLTAVPVFDGFNRNRLCLLGEAGVSIMYSFSKLLMMVLLKPLPQYLSKVEISRPIIET